jgi:hypothetical protein
MKRIEEVIEKVIINVTERERTRMDKIKKKKEQEEKEEALDRLELLLFLQ